MSQNNFMFEWKKHEEYYDKKEDGTFVIHEDAPQEIKDSFEEYQRLCVKMDDFAKRKTGLGFTSLFKGSKKEGSKKESSKTMVNKNEILPVFDVKSKQEIMTMFGYDITTKRCQRCVELPFWKSRFSQQTNGYLCAEKSGEAGLEIVMLHGSQEAINELYFEVKNWGKKEGISYCLAKVEVSDEPMKQMLQSMQFKVIDTYENQDETMLVFVRSLL